LVQHGARACTDVTGFGLLGHLVEMLQTQRLGAQLDMACLPLLDGALAAMEAGIFSSLHSSNAQQGAAIAGWPRDAQASPVQVSDMRRAVLFDPQTAGGLLASVPWEQAQACLQALQAQGYSQSALIGRVCEVADFRAPITLVEQ